MMVARVAQVGLEQVGPEAEAEAPGEQRERLRALVYFRPEKLDKQGVQVVVAKGKTILQAQLQGLMEPTERQAATILK